jgi:hypothetical protein
VLDLPGNRLIQAVRLHAYGQKPAAHDIHELMINVHELMINGVVADGADVP